MVAVTPSVALLCWALLSVARADEAQPEAMPPSPTPPPQSTSDKISRPLHCTTVVVNPLLPVPSLSTHVCQPYTRSLCANPCAYRNPCLAVIRTTTEYIPCQTDCCRTTATVTNKSCTICEICPYQETKLVMTGCSQAPKPDNTRTITMSGVTISKIDSTTIVTKPGRKDPALPTNGADW